jgi:hypothetical protein
LVATELSPTLIEAGSALVKSLDKARVDVTAAFWLLSGEERGWQLVIASSEVERFGARAFYGKISSLVAAIPALSLSYISARKPNDQVVRLLRRVVTTGAGISGIRFTGNVVDGVPIPDAHIYRIL